MALAAVSLDDKYDLAKQPVLVSGSEAVVRLMLMQRARDRRQGKNTAGYVTGYRGAPLAGLDKALWGAAGVLQPAGIVFNPAVNEALAATALWGTQQAELRGDGRGDGVFGLWYGTGSGVDRAGDGLKHANLAGTSPWGGVLALIGDDHECAFADAAHQSEHALVDAMIPVLAPAGLQEILDYGLFGYALSRYAGTWVGLKCVGDTVAARATVDGALDRIATVIPGGFRMAPGGLSIRAHDDPIAQEERLHEFKIPAVLAFVRATRPTGWCSPAGASRASVSSRRARAISMSSRPSTTSASTRCVPPISASGCSRSPAPGRSNRGPSVPLPRGSRRSSWWRRSAA